MESTPKEPVDEEKNLKAVLSKADENEVALTDEEQTRDFSKMSTLDLGDQGNYKTRLVQNRWSQHRNAWLDTKKELSYDPKLGKPTKAFPVADAALRKREKRTMKSSASPYEPFETFYELNDIIDAYMEIWYKDDSSDSSSN